MRALRWTGWVTGVLCVGGVALSSACLCDPAPSGARGTARRCSYAGIGDAAASETRNVEVGELRDGAFVPWVDGGEATLVRGFQGSDMVLAVVRVPAMPSDPGEVCALVDLTVETEGTPLTSSLAWLLRRDGDFLQSGTIELPLFATGSITVTGVVTGTPASGPTFASTLEPRTLRLR